jgi:hypothetical protein
VLHKGDAKVIHCARVFRIHHQRGPARLDRMLAIAELPVGLAQVGIKIRTAYERDRSQDSFNG